MPSLTAVTELKREATRIIDSLSSEPVFITEHGKSKAVLMSVEVFTLLQRRLMLLEGIARGERALQEGRVVIQADAEARLSKWL